MNLINKLKEIYYKDNSKRLVKYKYTKYDLEITYEDGTTKLYSYSGYFGWDSNDFIRFKVLDRFNTNFYIDSGKAINKNSIKSMKAIKVDSICLYFLDTLSDFPYSWFSDEGVKYQQEKYKNEMKYLKEE